MQYVEENGQRVLILEKRALNDGAKSGFIVIRVSVSRSFDRHFDS
jgi:hypothetical protein